MRPPSSKDARCTEHRSAECVRLRTSQFAKKRAMRGSARIVDDTISCTTASVRATATAGDTWRLGVTVFKSPFDLWVYQEILNDMQPDLIIETGTGVVGVPCTCHAVRRVRDNSPAGSVSPRTLVDVVVALLAPDVRGDELEVVESEELAHRGLPAPREILEPDQQQSGVLCFVDRIAGRSIESCREDVDPEHGLELRLGPVEWSVVAVPVEEGISDLGQRDLVPRTPLVTRRV